MKWVAGFILMLLFMWMIGPMLFHAMVKKDYDTLYSGFQDAKRQAGAYVADDANKKNVMSYSEKYVRGLEDH